MKKIVRASVKDGMVNLITSNRNSMDLKDVFKKDSQPVEDTDLKIGSEISDTDINIFEKEKFASDLTLARKGDFPPVTQEKYPKRAAKTNLKIEVENVFTRPSRVP